jgi:uncharacterized membrane protein
MTKIEYLTELTSALNHSNVEDVEDIVAEYEQHFLFKLADGFSEEQIAAKLGVPSVVAAQFTGSNAKTNRGTGKKVLLTIWLTLVGIFEGSLYLTFFSFAIALFAAALAIAGLGAEMIAGLNWMNLLPPMPYAGALVFGMTLLALGVILFLAAVYCFAYLRQMVRASLRWRKNTLTGAALPSLPQGPQFSPKAKRRMRSVFLWSVMIFGTTFVLGYALLGIFTQSWEFWHALGWFGYIAS